MMIGDDELMSIRRGRPADRHSNEGNLEILEILKLLTTILFYFAAPSRYVQIYRIMRICREEFHELYSLLIQSTSSRAN